MEEKMGFEVFLKEMYRTIFYKNGLCYVNCRSQLHKQKGKSSVKSERNMIYGW